jgi:hypothetical protein
MKKIIFQLIILSGCVCHKSADEHVDHALKCKVEDQMVQYSYGEGYSKGYNDGLRKAIQIVDSLK